MSHEAAKYASIASRLLRLTHNGELQWKREPRPLGFVPADAYVAIYKDRKFVLTNNPRDLKYESPNFLPVRLSEYRLVVPATDAEPELVFPPTQAVLDLVDAVRRQEIKALDNLERLLS